MDRPNVFLLNIIGTIIVKPWRARPTVYGKQPTWCLSFNVADAVVMQPQLIRHMARAARRRLPARAGCNHATAETRGMRHLPDHAAQPCAYTARGLGACPPSSITGIRESAAFLAPHVYIVVRRPRLGRALTASLYPGAYFCDYIHAAWSRIMSSALGVPLSRLGFCRGHPRS